MPWHTRLCKNVPKLFFVWSSSAPTGCLNLEKKAEGLNLALTLSGQGSKWHYSMSVFFWHILYLSIVLHTVFFCPEGRFFLSFFFSSCFVDSVMIAGDMNGVSPPPPPPPPLPSSFYPTTNGGMQNEGSVGIRTHCTHVFPNHQRIGGISEKSRYYIPRSIQERAHSPPILKKK